MSIGLLIFYGVAVAIIISGGLTVFLLVRRKSRLLAAVSGFASTSVLVLIWPIPLHGGFMTLGEAIYDEWSRDRQEIAQLRMDEEKQSYLERFQRRFTDELPILGKGTVGYGWQSVEYAPGQSAWLDTANGQIWSDWLPLPDTRSMPSLEMAKRRCRAYPPAGYWSLATEAEHALMWKAGGFKVLPPAGSGSISYVVDVDFRMEFATYDLGTSSNAAAEASGRFAVRCVARGPGGPAAGYMKKDISIDDWNRYQLSKST